MSVRNLTETEILANAAAQIAGSNQELMLRTQLVTSGAVVGPSNPLDVAVSGAVSGSFTPGGLHTGLKARRYTVTDTPGALPVTPLTGRNGVSIRVLGSSAVYFGGSDLTAAQGYPKFQYEEVVVDATDDTDVAVWAVCATGQTCEVAVLEIA